MHLWAHLKTAVVITVILVAALSMPVGAADPAASKAEGAVHPGSAMISGAIGVAPGQHRAESLFLENLDTEEVVVVPLEPGQDTYAAEVPPGIYRAYAWSADFSLMAGHTTCGSDWVCADHTLLPIAVADGDSVTGVDLIEWSSPDSPVIALSGRLIDGTGAEPIEEGVLLIWEQHIVAVGSEAELAIPAAAVHHHLPGTTILPGFINTHVHNAYQPENLERWATAGVTTVRDLGAPVSSGWDTDRTYLEDDPRYARILAAGPLVTCPGGYPIVPNGFPSLTVDSEQEAREEIENLIDRGADVIKIVIESGVPEVLPVEHAAVIVDTARQRGIPVTVHLNLARDLRTALEAGVDDVAHLVVDYVPDELIQAMVDAGVGWVPTMAVMDQYAAQMHDNLRRFVGAGGRVALGNDAGYIRGLVIGMPMPEIEAMEFAGMSPMQIIVAATSDAAVVCDRQNLLGTLEPGRLADVLVVQGDPLIDLRALEEVRMVIHDGVIIRHLMPPPRRAGRRMMP